MKSLKDQGVPFGARVVFRLQHLPFLIMALIFVLTIPAIAVWGVVHESGTRFLEGVTDVLRSRVDDLTAHRARLVKMYGGDI